MSWFHKAIESHARTWGSNADGSPYIVGMTVAELRQELSRFPDDTEVCVTVCRKKDRNGGGLVGKIKTVERGIPSQIWLKGQVLDESME